MGSLPRVFHRAAKPIAVEEFADAVRASCPPKFPRARAIGHRPVGIAVSGGVDSMALAFLLSALKSYDGAFVIGDTPFSRPKAYVIDHGLRRGSAQEAICVVEELNKLPCIEAYNLKIHWADIIPSLGPNPDSVELGALSNMETLARKGRYRLLGATCARHGVDNLFFAHHADDQHETVLMRMLKGHTPRGLMGMRPYNDIPECHGMHGAHQSGIVELMAMKKTPLTYKPTRRDIHRLRRELVQNMRGRGELRFAADDGVVHMDTRLADANPPAGTSMGDYFPEPADTRPFEAERGGQRAKPDLDQLQLEDGGVRICRPLLGFEKDRLIATCEANGIKWFEDPTNQDPGLTPRNAVRCLVRDHKLPQALQRPAILQLAGRLRERAKEEDEEVSELLERCNLEFLTNTGVLTVQFPTDLGVEEGGGDLEKTRTLAALLVKKMIMVVTPEATGPVLPALQNAVSRIFPHLATDTYPAFHPPKAFNVAGVHLSPLAPKPRPVTSSPEQTPHDNRVNEDASSNDKEDRPVTWQLSREPYPSYQPLPYILSTQAKGHPFGPVTRVECKEHWSFVKKPFELFDGRFWVGLRLRLAGTFVIAPFRPRHAKRFRESLDPADRKRMESLLAEYAPGKIRYTLPALYYKGEIDWETFGASVGYTGQKGLPDLGVGEVEWDENLSMLALPSLGVHLPKLGAVAEYQVRYRKVDKEILDKCNIYTYD